MSIWLMIYYVLAPPICIGGLIFVKAIELGGSLVTYAMLSAGVVIINANLLWIIHYSGGSVSGQQSRLWSLIETALAGIGAGVGTAFIVWVLAPVGAYIMKDWMLVAVLLSAANLIGAYSISSSGDRIHDVERIASRRIAPQPNSPSRSSRRSTNEDGSDRYSLGQDASDRSFSDRSNSERSALPVNRHFRSNDWFSPVGNLHSFDTDFISLIEEADSELAANRLLQANSLYQQAIEVSQSMADLPTSIWRAQFGMTICSARLNRHAEAVSRAVDLLNARAPISEDAFLTILDYSGLLIDRQSWREASDLLTALAEVSGNRIDQARQLVVLIRLSLALIHTNQLTQAIALLNNVNSRTPNTIALNRRDSTHQELSELCTQLTALGESSARQSAHALSSVVYATVVRLLNLLKASS